MATLAIINVSAVKSSSLFMVCVDAGKLNIIKSWGRASYPVPCAIVMDKDTDAIAMLKSCGLTVYDVKTHLDYANNIFSDDKELAKLNAMVCGKGHTVSPVATPAPSKVATQAPIVSIEHDATDVPSTLADALSDYDKKAINFKAFRAVCLAEGMPEKLTSPNAVTHWARNQAASQHTATVATPVSEAVAAPNNDMMAQFLAFQAFMQSQAK